MRRQTQLRLAAGGAGKPIPFADSRADIVISVWRPGQQCAYRGGHPFHRRLLDNNATPWPKLRMAAAGGRLSHYYEQTSDPALQTAILINGIPASESTITRLLARPFSLPVVDDRRHQRAVLLARPALARRPADESPATLRGGEVIPVRLVGASPASMGLA